MFHHTLVGILHQCILDVRLICHMKKEGEEKTEHLHAVVENSYYSYINHNWSYLNSLEVERE
jgi:hypothetical protein